jgi:LPXTG-motif cell wall-anchored protein
VLQRLPTRIALLAVSGAALCLAPLAAAHGDENSLPGYLSKVTSVSPSVDGLTAEIIENDSEVELTNGTGKTIVVYGYEHEPYLRFGPGGVFENMRSPAAFLNEDRFGKTKPPAHASATAPPQWRRVASGTSFGWHDHRIHWMSPIPPPAVKADESKAHHVFDWKIEAAVAGKPIAINGTLDYAPPGGSGSNTMLFVGGGAAVLLVAAGGFLLWRRRRGSAPPAAQATTD